MRAKCLSRHRLRPEWGGGVMYFSDPIFDMWAYYTMKGASDRLGELSLPGFLA